MSIDDYSSDRLGQAVRIGMLYPTRDCGEDDFVALARRIDPAITLQVAYVSWPGGWDAAHELDAAGKLDALRELGSAHRLAAAADELAGFAPDVLTWACTSGSFLHELGGARRQAQLLGDRLGVPASSTSLAFLAATGALGLTRVSVGSVYNTIVTDAFIGFLAAGGVQTVHRIDLNAYSDRDLATWDRGRILGIADKSNTEDAQAILIPETALHTADLLTELETRAGKPVLTATQVTLWHAMHQLGRYRPRTGLGALFAS